MDFEIFGRSYRAYSTESEPREFILKLAGYVKSKMKAVLDRTHNVTTLDAATREDFAVRAALDIAEEYFLVKTALDKSEASVQPRLANRERRAHHYTKRTHERELLALLEDPTLPAQDRHEVLRDLGKIARLLPGSLETAYPPFEPVIPPAISFRERGISLSLVPAWAGILPVYHFVSKIRVFSR